MRKISSLIMVLVLMASSLAGNTWFLEAADETAELGIEVVDKTGAPIEGAFVRITQRAALTPDPQNEGSYIQGPFADLAEAVEVSTDANGVASFQLPYPYEYKVQVEKQVGEDQEPYHLLNFSVGNITEFGSNQQVVMYQKVQVIRVQNPGEGEKTVAATKTSDPNGVNIVLNQDDIASQISAGVTHYYAYFIEELWDVSTMGLPYNYLNRSASMQSLDQEPFFVNVHVPGEGITGTLFVGFMKNAAGEGQPPTWILEGFYSEELSFEGDSEPGGDPGPGPGGENLSGTLEFEYLPNQGEGQNPAEVSTLSVPYNYNQNDILYVPVTTGGAATIHFPTIFQGKETPEDPEFTVKAINLVRFFGHMSVDGDDFMDNPNAWLPTEVNINNFGGSVTEGGNFNGQPVQGYLFSYAQDFERVQFEVEIEGLWKPLVVVFYQTGYETIDIEYSVNGDNGTKTANGRFEVPNSQWQYQHSVGIPADMLEGDITIRGILEDESDMDNFFGGIWEYLADRSMVVEAEGFVDGSTQITVERYFGKVTLHVQYLFGNSWEGMLLTFYEPDFVGMDVFGAYGAGDWHTGITNASNPDAVMPTGFIYFLNTQVYLKPSIEGREYTIMGVDNDWREGETFSNSASYNDALGIEAWDVPLADYRLEPISYLGVQIQFIGSEETSVVPLEIRRVLFDSASYDYTQGLRDDIMSGQEEIDYEYYGEDQITFVNVFSYEPFEAVQQLGEEEPIFQRDPSYGGAYFELDHTLLVIYYENDRVLGSKQFSVSSEFDGMDRTKVAVFRKGQPEYASVAAANRITVFLLSKDGVSSGASSFGGATFGIGAGWGHLMPNHPEYGLGKDGM